MLRLMPSPLLRQYVLVIIVNMGALWTGISISWASPMLVKLTNGTTVLSQPLTDEEGSWITSVTWLSSAFSIPFTGLCLHFFGRKHCLYLAALFRLGGFLFITFANRFYLLLIGRILNGFADGFTCCAVLVYSSEIASKEFRGSLGSVWQVVSSIAVVFVLSIGPFITYFTFSLLCTIIIGVTAVPILFIPDSPYFLYIKGRTDEALKLLILLRGSENLAKEELIEYALSINEKKVNKLTLLKHRPFLKSLLLATIVYLGPQITGYNTITFYLQTILESTGTNVRSEIASVVVGLIQLFSSCSLMTLSDRFGRKPIIYVSLSGTAIGMMGLGLFFFLKRHDNLITGALNYLPLISLVFVVFSYSGGFGCVMWPLSAELFDGEGRNLGMTISQIISVLIGFTITKSLVVFVTVLGPASTYLFFAGTTILTCLLIAFFVPETNAKTFAEIQVTLAGNKKGTLPK